MRDPVATQEAIHAFAQDLVDEKPVEQFIRKCVNRADYEMRRAANECVTYNAKKDPKKPRWARVPTGIETCKFCIMLASKGFAYHSEEMASHSHARCDCRVIPSWDKSPLAQGYDPAKYYDMYKNPEKYAAQNNTEDKGDMISVSGGSSRKSASERKALFDEYKSLSEEMTATRRALTREKDAAKKEQLRIKIDGLDIAVKNARSKLTNGEFLLETARIYPIKDFNAPVKWDKKPSSDEIIKMLGGGDRTQGSCSSLAFAYFGNMGGSVVRDFRGGKSCDFFSTFGHIKDIGKIDGIETTIESHNNAFKAAQQAFEHVNEGKQYYFCVAKHAAVIEKKAEKLYYLELQTEDENGWFELNNSVLKSRFGCTKSRTISGIKVEQDAFLIDGDTLTNNSEFMELLGYINTPESEQKKGVGGGAK